MGANISYTIYDPPGIIVARMRGRITLKELLQHQDELLEDPLFRNNLDKIVDMSLVESLDLHLEDEHQLVNYKMAKGIRERRMAFIAKDDLHFGMSRMYQIVSEDVHQDVHVVRNLEEALAWLNINPNFAHIPLLPEITSAIRKEVK